MFCHTHLMLGLTKEDQIGYEIPFTREFYKYVAPRKSEEIFAHLKELEQQEAELMTKILG